MASSELGTRLKQIRQAHQLTQTALADQLHVSRQTISSWETGRNQPDIATITQLATLYAVPVTALLSDTVTKAESETTLVKHTDQPGFGLPSALLAVLIVERITQFSTFHGLYWMDVLILLLVGLIINIYIAHRHPNAWTQRIHWSGLTLVAILSFVSGSLNAFHMGFGFATTCQVVGLVSAFALVKKYWQSRSAN